MLVQTVTINKEMEIRFALLTAIRMIDRTRIHFISFSKRRLTPQHWHVWPTSNTLDFDGKATKYVLRLWCLGLWRLAFSRRESRKALLVALLPNGL